MVREKWRKQTPKKSLKIINPVVKKQRQIQRRQVEGEEREGQRRGREGEKRARREKGRRGRKREEKERREAVRGREKKVQKDRRGGAAPEVERTGAAVKSLTERVSPWQERQTGRDQIETTLQV